MREISTLPEQYSTPSLSSRLVREAFLSFKDPEFNKRRGLTEGITPHFVESVMRKIPHVQDEADHVVFISDILEVLQKVKELKSRQYEPTISHPDSKWVINEPADSRDVEKLEKHVREQLGI